MNAYLMKLARLGRKSTQHWFAVVCGIFMLYMFFGGEYSVVNILQLQAEESALRKEKQVFKDSLEMYEQRLKELDTDHVQLERIARERMLMHKENEDLYLIED